MKYLFVCSLFLGLIACSDVPEISLPRTTYFSKRFSHFIAVNAGSFKDVPGGWYQGYKFGSYALELNENGRFTYCQNTCCRGSYLSYGTWSRKGTIVVLNSDSGSAYSALIKPVVLNNDANIFQDTMLEYFGQQIFELRNDTLCAVDTSIKFCALTKSVFYEEDNPYVK